VPVQFRTAQTLYKLPYRRCHLNIKAQQYNHDRDYIVEICFYAIFSFLTSKTRKVVLFLAPQYNDGRGHYCGRGIIFNFEFPIFTGRYFERGDPPHLARSMVFFIVHIVYISLRIFI